MQNDGDICCSIDNWSFLLLKNQGSVHDNCVFLVFRLSKELLLDPQQSLVFKVWHKGGKDTLWCSATLCLWQFKRLVVQWFFPCRGGAGDWVRVCRSVTSSVWISVSLRLVQHHWFQRAMSGTAKGVCVSSESSSGAAGTQTDFTGDSCCRLQCKTFGDLFISFFFPLLIYYHHLLSSLSSSVLYRWLFAYEDSRSVLALCKITVYFICTVGTKSNFTFENY